MRAEAFIRPGLEVRYTVVERAQDIIPAVTAAIAAAGNGDRGEHVPEKF